MPPAKSSEARLIDVVLDDCKAPNFARAFEIVRQQGGATVGVGRYPGRVFDGKPVCYLKVKARTTRGIAARLAAAGYTVVRGSAPRASTAAR